MKPFIKVMAFAFAGLLVSSGMSRAEEQYMDPELFDIDRIVQEEGLGETSNLERVYLFLAVLNHDGDGYKTYAARGDEDRSGDGNTVMESPNNLEDYEEVGKFDQVITISRNVHICYITSFPKYEDLFPGESDPIEKEGGIVEVTTEETLTNGDGRRLLGSRVLPVLGPTGNAEGFRRFVAFYNTDEEMTVTSYGFIGMDFSK